MEVTHAVVLKVSDYSDTQRIIYTFSKEKGYLSFIAPAFFFKKKNTTVAVMQVVEVEYFEQGEKELRRVKQLHPVQPNSSVYFDIYKMNIALLWGEVLNLVLKKETRNEDLYDYLQHAAGYLNAAHEGVANFNLFFLYRLASFLGFRINTDSYSEGFVFDLNSGNFIPSETGSGYVSGPNSARTIHKLCSSQLETLKDIVLDRKSRGILLDLIILFYSIHLNINFNIKSIKVIREIFD